MRQARIINFGALPMGGAFNWPDQHDNPRRFVKIDYQYGQWREEKWPFHPQCPVVLWGGDE